MARHRSRSRFLQGAKYANAIRASAEVSVAFQDADPTGDAWHGNYFRYFDVARSCLLEKLNYSYQAMADSGYTWPIVDTRVRYIKAARFGETLQVEATLIEWEFRLRMEYLISNAAGERVTEAYTVQVPVDRNTGEMRLGSPQVLIAAVSDYLEHNNR